MATPPEFPGGFEATKAGLHKTQRSNQFTAHLKNSFQSSTGAASEAKSKSSTVKASQEKRFWFRNLSVDQNRNVTEFLQSHFFVASTWLLPSRR